MSKQKHATQAIKEQIYSNWSARSQEQRTTNCVDSFKDEAWNGGMRLDATRFIHDQILTDLIRSKIHQG